VTAEKPEVAAAPGASEEPEEEALKVKPAWAVVAAKGVFFPAAKWIHPAYALTDEEAVRVAPEMQVFLQSLADKYAPVAVSRIANRYPEFADLIAALGTVYYHKWRAVKKLVAEEEQARREAGANAKNVTPVAVMPTPEAIQEEPELKVVGQRMRDGSLVV
jgi:hypothetical protein